MQKKKTEAIVVDKRPTMAEWPVRIWAMEEIPEIFDLEARKSMKGTFNQYRHETSRINTRGRKNCVNERRSRSSDQRYGRCQ